MKIEVDDSNRMRFPDLELERGKKLLEKLPMRLSKIEDTQVLTKYRANMALPGERWLLVRDGDFWAVSYTERGLRFSPAFFWGIEDAIQFFLFKLTGTIVEVDLRE